MPMKPAMAIVTPNLLMGLGLRSLLGELLPGAEIVVFQRFDDFAESNADRYVHYFVDTRTFLRHDAFFRARRQHTILLMHGRRQRFADMHCIDAWASQERLVGDILRLHRGVHGPGHGIPAQAPSPALLTTRETEVLTLIARGLMNKEIADRLGIGTTTVISHRRSIMDKLGIKSIAGLTLYAAALGYVNADELCILTN